MHLPPGVGEDDGLGDGQGLVEVAQSVQFPLLALHVDVELLDTLQGQLIALHQNAHLPSNAGTYNQYTGLLGV